MPTYLATCDFHACDTCGRPCCGRGFYPMPGDADDDTGAPLTGETVEYLRASFEHWQCEHSNRPCGCGGTRCASERVGDPDGDLDAGWY
jgi:hypothetical protein